jgi:hypothetical protein
MFICLFIITEASYLKKDESVEELKDLIRSQEQHQLVHSKSKDNYGEG